MSTLPCASLIELAIFAMSYLQYLKKANRPDVFFPDPISSLPISLPPPVAIHSTNVEVRQCVTSSGMPVCCNQPQHYNSYTPRQKAAIGNYAVENGVMAAQREFLAQLKLDINESTV